MFRPNVKSKWIVLLLLLLWLPLAAEPASFEPGGSGKLNTNVRVLLAGDSLMEALGPQLKEALSGYAGFEFFPIGKRSTGLCRPDFYNWPEVLEKNLQEHRPHIVVMWIGTNDNQGIYGMKGLGEATSPEWMKAYYTKVQEIVNLCRKYNATIMFMSPPVMQEAKFNEELRRISSVIEYACKQHNLLFLNTRPVLADSKGAYLQSGQLKDGRVVELRTRDTVHITNEGNKLIMSGVCSRLYWLIYHRMPTRNGFAAPSAGSGLKYRRTGSVPQTGSGSINGEGRAVVPTSRGRR